jgi:hypothetical protein
MDRTEQIIVFETLERQFKLNQILKQREKMRSLELEFRLTQLLKKREQLYLKGCNDEKLNDKIRTVQQELRNKGSN